MSEVHRRRGETFDAFLRRFSRKVQMSGRVLQAKKIRFHARPKSKGQQRASALVRVERARYLEHLDRLGKLEEELEKMKGKKRRRR